MQSSIEKETFTLKSLSLNMWKVQIFILQELTSQSEPIPKNIKDAVILTVWASGIPGKSKREEPLRIKLKSDTGLVKQNQYPLKLES